jgi:hypothetical protein
MIIHYQCQCAITTHPYRYFKHRICSTVLDVKRSKHHKAECFSLNQQGYRKIIYNFPQYMQLI